MSNDLKFDIEQLQQDRNPASQLMWNVSRLVDDARLLFQSGRFASSVTLSIIAMEEFAKFVSLTGSSSKDLPIEKWRFHSEKQAHITGVTFFARFQTALKKVMDEEKIESLEAEQIKHDVIAFMRDAENHHMANKSSELFFRAYQSTLSDKSFIRYMRAFMKDTERDKQKSLYVDIQMDKTILSTPAQITKEIAQEYRDTVKDIAICLKSLHEIPRSS